MNTLIDSIEFFISKYCTGFKIQGNETNNNCAGALLTANDFYIFKENFGNRFNRIVKKLKTEDEKKELACKLRDIFKEKGVKWSGPYSELVALDIFLNDEYISECKYVKKSSGKRIANSIASKCGQKEIDNDLFLQYCGMDLYADVKSLIPNTTEILQHIISDIEANVSSKVMIGIDDCPLFTITEINNNLTTSYNTIKSSLQTAVNNGSRSFSYTICGKTISFVISYGGCLSTTNSFNPYKAASIDTLKIINYYNKLLPNDYSMLILVTNPWFNGQINDFANFDKLYFRSLARRVFIEQNKNQDLLSSINQACKMSSVKISEVSEQIAGIVFVEDLSIEKKSDKIYRCFVYYNPNYKNKKTLNRYSIHQFLRSDLVEVIESDDFMFDNY